MNNIMLKAAIEYREHFCFSVLPIDTSEEKKPLIKWAEYQKRLPEKKEIEDWWKRWPKANVGCATGKISGIDVIDADDQAAYDKLNEHLTDVDISDLPGQFMLFSSKQPGGFFYEQRSKRRTGCQKKNGDFGVCPVIGQHI